MMITQGFHIKNENAANDKAKSLSLCIGERHLGFCITDTDASSLYELEWYANDGITTDFLEDIHARHPGLGDNYVRTEVCYDYPYSVLVPAELYKEGHESQYLDTMYGLAGNEIKLTENINDWQIRNVYAVPKNIHDWVWQNFPRGNFWHKYTIGLNNVARNSGIKLLIDFQELDFSVLLIRGEQLLLARTFGYQTPADVVYYLLRACDQFHLPPETVPVLLSGQIEKDSGLFKEIYQYFLHVDFRNSTWKQPMDEKEYPLHFFTSLNDLARCAL